MAPRPQTHTRALARVRAGQMSVAEAAFVYEIDRVTLWRQCRAAGIDPKRARAAWLIRQREKRDAPPPRGPSKRMLRAEVDAALKNFRLSGT